MEFITALSQNIQLLNNILLIGFFFVFAFVFWRESKNPETPVHWTDLLVDKKNGKLSLTQLGKFWGIATSTWVVIYMVQGLSKEQISSIFPWIFGTWLTYLVAESGIKKFTMSKDKSVVEMNQDKKEVE